MSTKESDRVKIEIGTRTFLRFFLVLFALVGLFVIRDILVVVFVSFLIASGLNPLIEIISKRVPRPLAVVLVYLLILVIIAGLAWLLKASIGSEFVTFRQQIEAGVFNFNLFGYHLSGQALYQAAVSQLSYAQFGAFIETTGRFVGGVVAAITAFVVSFYFLLDKAGIEKTILHFLPESSAKPTVELIRKIESKLGDWLRGQFALMLIVALMTLVGFSLLGVPYALTLAVIAGLTEAIPTVGPLLGGITAVLVTAASAPDKLIWVVLLAVAIQWVEGHFVVPVVMRRVLGLSPVIVIISLLVGAKLMGLAGAVLAVPSVAALRVLIAEWPHYKTALNEGE